MQGSFSVIIPTLQRSRELGPLVEQCAEHRLVKEVLVINNDPRPLGWESPKVRVLQQAENIYVNPAWNLGAREARGEFLAIINDDVRFEDEVFDYAAKILGRRKVGIVGPDKTNFYGPTAGGLKIRIATLDNIPFGFGTFMAMHREDYVPVPEEMPIWGGDDWLFLQQRRPNAVLIGTPFRTEMSTTAGAPEFQQVRASAKLVSDRVLGPLYGMRWWHRPVAGLAWARRIRHRLRSVGSAIARRG